MISIKKTDDAAKIEPQTDQLIIQQGGKLLFDYDDYLRTVLGEPEYILTGGTSAAYSVTIAGLALVSGVEVRLQAHVANAANCTLSVNGGEAVPIYNSGGDMLAAGDIAEGSYLKVVYNGALGRFFMLGGSSPVLTGTATPADVRAGMEFYKDNAKNKLVGTYNFDNPINAYVTGNFTIDQVAALSSYIHIGFHPVFLRVYRTSDGINYGYWINGPMASTGNTLYSSAYFYPSGLGFAGANSAYNSQNTYVAYGYDPAKSSGPLFSKYINKVVAAVGNPTIVDLGFKPIFANVYAIATSSSSSTHASGLFNGIEVNTGSGNKVSATDSGLSINVSYANTFYIEAWGN